MKRSIEYIQNHKDESFILTTANRMIEEGFDDDVVLLNVITYLNNLLKVKENILEAWKVA